VQRSVIECLEYLQSTRILELGARSVCITVKRVSKKHRWGSHRLSSLGPGLIKVCGLRRDRFEAPEDHQALFLLNRNHNHASQVAPSTRSVANRKERKCGGMFDVVAEVPPSFATLTL
jgi:hypothetical protein